MVFFTCNHCGESVKKPAVEKHYNTRCRGAVKNVSCMDCQKDFREEEYVAHTKCITEAQKYSGKDYVHKESKNSGAKKQESWMDIIRSILRTKEYNLNSQTRNSFQRLQSVDNVPRKKAKFMNFISNCMRMPKAHAEEVWNILEKEMEKMKKAREQGADVEKKTNGALQNGSDNKETEQNENDEPAKKMTKKDVTSAKNLTNGIEVSEQNGASKKGKKRKHTISENGEPPQKKTESSAVEAVDGGVDEFQWATVLQKIVSKHSDGIAFDKLKQKTLKKYLAKQAIDELTEKQTKKFEKKFTKNLKKIESIKIENDIVKIC